MRLNDDAKLQNQLGSALQKGGQQMKHAHVCKLVHHLPVPAPALRLCTLPAPHAQVDGAKVPEGHGREDGQTGNNEELF